ncbi:MAG TPA: cupin domain-containing protein [Candidatus Sulfotelmatobacter sp.]|jgi:quercetin dioxygenase-like cupin family protein
MPETQMFRSSLLLVTLSVSLTLVFICGVAWGVEPAKEIVLIGGAKIHGGIGQHDLPNCVAVLKELLDASPDAHDVRVVAYPDGWPSEASALDGASTIVFCFDGLESHPLLNVAHRAQFEKLMKAGVGVVAFHQASTVPADDKTLHLERWLGGARYGMFDRTDEPVLFTPADHPIGNGVGQFLLPDEFYPTIRFEDGKKITPILTGKLHPQFRDDKPIVIDKAEDRVVAWTFERDDRGRAFTFTGLHYLAGLDNPPLRKLVLNAIFWTAKIEVPKDGVTTTAPADAAQKLVNQELKAELEATARPKKTIDTAIVSPAANNQVIQYPWGQLTWYVSRELKNSDTMTVGEAVIKPGLENPRHFHPNCDEVLHVIKGRILQTVGDKSVEMNEGDTVSIPAGIRHNAKNIGTENAVLAISFSSATRKTIGE